MQWHTEFNHARLRLPYLLEVFTFPIAQDREPHYLHGGKIMAVHIRNQPGSTLLYRGEGDHQCQRKHQHE